MQFCQECLGRNRLRWINLHFVVVLRMQKTMAREQYVDERDKTDADSFSNSFPIHSTSSAILE